jgi:hypothetical protein
MSSETPEDGLRPMTPEDAEAAFNSVTEEECIPIPDAEIIRMVRIATVVAPIVHFNGTSACELVRLRSDAYDAIQEAARVLAQMGPNGRDYYPKPGLMDKAVAQHDRRMQTLRDLMMELENEIATIEGTQ